MKIVEMRIDISQNPFNQYFCDIWVRIQSEEVSEQYSLLKTYPIDHVRSLFDMVWEDIGKELKNKLVYENE